MNLLFFLHDRVPEAVAFTIGPITIYWYGLIMALSIIAGLSLALAIAKRRGLASEIVYDAGVWIIIGGLIGARLYEGFLEWEFYSAAPLEIFKVWHGGLAIHGALIGGAIALYLFSRQKKIRTKFNFWNIAAVLVPGLALAQAIGRWGNWFNQELFGKPSLLPWSIPIYPVNRPFDYEVFSFFHPTFLYESLGLVIIALILSWLSFKKETPCVYIVSLYLVAYGILRFLLEFIKIDSTPIVFGIRWPQIASIIMIALGIIIFVRVFQKIKKQSHNSTLL